MVRFGILAKYSGTQSKWYNQYKVPEDLGKTETANDTLMETPELLILKVLKFCCHLVTKNGKKRIEFGEMLLCKVTQTLV